MAKITLQDLASGHPSTSMIILETYIHKAKDGLTFIVGDNTKNCHLNVKKNPALGTKLTPGSFVRIINPEYDMEGDVVIAHEKTRIFACNKVHYLPLDEKDYEATDASYATLADISLLPIGSNVPTLVAKVVFASPAKKGGYSGSSMIAKVKCNVGHGVTNEHTSSHALLIAGC